MSEWKWCLDCPHVFKRHGTVWRDGEWTNGPCRADGCDCSRYVQEVANF